MNANPAETHLDCTSQSRADNHSTLFFGGQFDNSSSPPPDHTQSQVEIELMESSTEHSPDNIANFSQRQHFTYGSSGQPCNTIEESLSTLYLLNRQFQSAEGSSTIQSSLQAHQGGDNHFLDEASLSNEAVSIQSGQESEKEIHKRMVEHLIRTVCRERVQKAEEILAKEQEILDLHKELAVCHETIDKLLQAHSDLRLDCATSQRDLEGRIALALAQNKVLESKLAAMSSSQQGMDHEEMDRQANDNGNE